MRVGSVLVLCISVVLTVTVLFRDVGLNWLNGFTIVFGLASAYVAWRRPDHPPTILLAVLLVVIAALPAALGGVAFLFVPSLLMWLTAAAMSVRSSTSAA